jgi:predicted transcriptional regulator with HTH domain
MDETLALLIGPVSGLLGVGLGYVGSRRIIATEAQAARRTEIRRAVAAYLASLYPLVAELRAMPDVQPNVLSNALDRLSGVAATYVRTRRQLAKLGSRPWELSDSFAAAAANLQVLDLPADVRTAVAEANAYVEKLAETRSGELKAGWPAVWQQLQYAASCINE